MLVEVWSLFKDTRCRTGYVSAKLSYAGLQIIGGRDKHPIVKLHVFVDARITSRRADIYIR